MNIQVKILNIKTVNEQGDYRTNDDFVKLLDKMSFQDTDKKKAEDLKGMLYIANLILRQTRQTRTKAVIRMISSPPDTGYVKKISKAEITKLPSNF